MFVRPPVARSSRNPGRRPYQNRIPMNEVNRPLLRQFIRNRRSDPRFEAYILEVREGPAVNGNTNAAASKSIPQPWVSVRDSEKADHQIGLPVSICGTLLKHLLTCANPADATHADSSEESEIACNSSAAATDPQGGSPARASGDGKSPVDELTSGENSPSKKESRTRTKFQLSRLQPIRIVCETTGCTLEVIARDPTAKRTPASADEPEQPVPVDPSRRWIVSAPAETRTSNDALAENSTAQAGRRRHPWEVRGLLELHESLMPQLSAFIADVVTRYRPVDELPEVRSLYSASGGRRFFFDLRDTRWGKRLHISQVTDLHRNVIGIPLEAVVSFRTRLDMIIRSLKLEDQHVLRSEIYGSAPDRTSPRGGGQRRAFTSSRDRDTGDRDEQTGDSRKETRSGRGEYYGPRQRGRERRRQRVRSFTNNTQQPQSRNTDSAPEQVGVELSSNRNVQSVPSNQQQWNGNTSRNRRFARRPRNARPFNRPRRPAPARNEDRNNNGEPSEAPASTTNTTALPSVPQPAIDPGHVAQVAEASA